MDDNIARTMSFKCESIFISIQCYDDVDYRNGWKINACEYFIGSSLWIGNFSSIT